MLLLLRTLLDYSGSSSWTSMSTYYRYTVPKEGLRYDIQLTSMRIGT